MSLQAFKKSIVNANKIVEDAAVASAASTVDALTSQYTPDLTTFTFSSDGVLFGQLELDLKTLAGSKTTVTKEGGIIKVVTNNPDAANKVFIKLGIKLEQNTPTNIPSTPIVSEV